MKAEKNMIEVMKSCEIVHNLESDEEFRQSFFELADGIQSQYENICRRHEDFCEASVDEVEEFYSLYNYYWHNIRGNIIDAKLEYEYANFRQTKKAMTSYGKGSTRTLPESDSSRTVKGAFRHE